MDEQGQEAACRMHRWAVIVSKQRADELIELWFLESLSKAERTEFEELKNSSKDFQLLLNEKISERATIDNYFHSKFALPEDLEAEIESMLNEKRHRVTNSLFGWLSKEYKKLSFSYISGAATACLFLLVFTQNNNFQDYSEVYRGEPQEQIYSKNKSFKVANTFIYRTEQFFQRAEITLIPLKDDYFKIRAFDNSSEKSSQPILIREGQQHTIDLDYSDELADNITIQIENSEETVSISQ